MSAKKIHLTYNQKFHLIYNHICIYIYRLNTSMKSIFYAVYFIHPDNK